MLRAAIKASSARLMVVRMKNHFRPGRMRIMSSRLHQGINLFALLTPSAQAPAASRRLSRASRKVCVGVLAAIAGGGAEAGEALVRSVASAMRQNCCYTPTSEGLQPSGSTRTVSPAIAGSPGLLSRANALI